MLKVENVNVSYGSVKILWDVDFHIGEGEIITIIGPNGAGKTTIVKTIMGLLKPTSGTIEFNGNPIHLAPTHKIVEDGIALVPEGRELFPRMTIMENLQMGAYTSDEKEDTLKSVFNLFPRLEERQKQSAGTMSGGEQQMLAIARGLMSRPKLLILDEPSLGLAPIMVKTVFDIVKTLNSEGVTVLLVEQNIHHALEASNRGYVLETGRITLEGSSSELLDNNHVKEAYLGM
ncbi:MAG: ABC transporter ATP-binding protein [ANME-2 cluster archaeon]|nr:ABC transporter ATP-binding protein [ANME-2 cluster archaeon]MBC2702427.1 ABC transporter ATP-binding protein [ANME-2 cluster archaeon]MBC2708349.1 ABC transporter ATP-binding protein [ANME-2 cluster archaeon]MBC2746686.1 ABC transporter ATP-binding protein [ANME-2 cluster archaeon]